MLEMKAPGSSRAAEDILKIRDEVLEGLEHDLKNAVSSIVMNISLAKRLMQVAEQQAPDKDPAPMLDRILAAAEKIGFMMQEAMDLTQCASGSLEIHPIQRDAKVLVQDAILWAEKESQEKDVQLKTELNCAIGNLSVFADQDKIPKAMAKLLLYAVKIAKPSSVIRIGLSEDRPGWIEFRILVDAITAPSTGIFERNGKKSNLALVQGVVQAFGGKTWVKPVHRPQVQAEQASELGQEIELGISLKRA